MRWVDGLVIIILVTTGTGIGCVVILSVMTSDALGGNQGMCA